MGKSSQRKGRSAELSLAKYLQEMGYQVQAGLPANHGTTPDIIGLPYFHIEVKRTERLDLSGAMKQAERDSEKFNDGMPVVLHKRNREPWLATLNIDDFLELLDYYVEARSKE